jgi:acyl-CoA thioesterase-1
MMRLLLSTLLLAPALVWAEGPVILVLGDSLSAGYGLPQERGWVSLLERRVRENGYPQRVVNASVSGDTTAGGLTRLSPLLKRYRPAVLVIELGANDGLRGLRPDEIKANLTRLVDLGRGAGSRVLLIGVRLPPNYGAAYTDRFQAVFREVAQREQVSFVPELLAGVAEHWNLMQPDGLHPTAEAQPRLLDNVWPVLAPLLQATAPAGGK